MPLFFAVPKPVNVPSGHLAAELGLPAKGPASPRLIIGRRRNQAGLLVLASVGSRFVSEIILQRDP